MFRGIIVAFVVFMETGTAAKLLVQYPKRQQGNRVFEWQILPSTAEDQCGRRDSADLRLVPLAALPTTFANFHAHKRSGLACQRIVVLLGHGQPLFILLYAAGIIFFCFFYTAIVFNPEETADNLKKYGGFIPGIRPGKRTAEYIDYVLTRITVVGSLYLAFVCLIPEVLGRLVYNGSSNSLSAGPRS